MAATVRVRTSEIGAKEVTTQDGTNHPEAPEEAVVAKAFVRTNVMTHRCATNLAA